MLIDIRGHKVPIKSLQDTVYQGDVVNFAADTEQNKSHIIFAGGLAIRRPHVGSLHAQAQPI